METITLKKKIELTPDSLYNYKEIILEKLREYYTDKCFKEFGLVKSIYPDIKIIDNIVSRVNCNIIFHVEFTLESLNISIGKEFVMVVSKINPKYIIGNIENKISVLISPETLIGYKYCDIGDSGGYFLKKRKKIAIGDKIRVKVIKTKYKNSEEIMVIGEFVE